MEKNEKICWTLKNNAPGLCAALIFVFGTGTVLELAPSRTEGTTPFVTGTAAHIIVLPALR